MNRFFNWFRKPEPKVETKPEPKFIPEAYTMGASACMNDVSFHSNPFSDSDAKIFDFIRWHAGWQNIYTQKQEWQNAYEKEKLNKGIEDV